MKLPQKFHEAREWGVTERDTLMTFLIVAAVLTVVFCGYILNGFLLPRLYGVQAGIDQLKRELPFPTITAGDVRTPCDAHGKKLLGFVFYAQFGPKKTDLTEGKMCWDIFKSRWDWEFSDPRFSRYNFNPVP